MGDLGADIIKIESAGGDIMRHHNFTFKAGVGSCMLREQEFIVILSAAKNLEGSICSKRQRHQ